MTLFLQFVYPLEASGDTSTFLKGTSRVVFFLDIFV